MIAISIAILAAVIVFGRVIFRVGKVAHKLFQQADDAAGVKVLAGGDYRWGRLAGWLHEAIRKSVRLFLVIIPVAILILIRFDNSRPATSWLARFGIGTGTWLARFSVGTLSWWGVLGVIFAGIWWLTRKSTVGIEGVDKRSIEAAQARVLVAALRSTMAKTLDKRGDSVDLSSVSVARSAINGGMDFGFKVHAKPPIGTAIEAISSLAGAGMGKTKQDVIFSSVSRLVASAKGDDAKMLRRNRALPRIMGTVAVEVGDGVDLYLMTRDPLAVTPLDFPWAPGTTLSRLVQDPCPVGIDRLGNFVWLKTGDRNTAIQGMTRTGKSSVEKPILATQCMLGNVALILCDPKHGAQFLPWKERASYVACSVEEIESVLAAVIVEMGVRGRWAAEHGHGEAVMTATPDRPHVRLVVDEVQDLTAEAMGLLRRIMKKCIELGITVDYLTQYGDAKTVPTGLSSQAENKPAAHVATFEQARVVTGQQCSTSNGPHQIPSGDAWKGVFFGSHEGGNGQMYRAFFMTHKEVRLWAKASAHKRVELPWLTKHMAGWQRGEEAGTASTTHVLTPDLFVDIEAHGPEVAAIIRRAYHEARPRMTIPANGKPFLAHALKAFESAIAHSTNDDDRLLFEATADLLATGETDTQPTESEETAWQR